MCAGERMRSGPAHRNGRSRPCAGSKFPRTCRSNTASSSLGAANGPVKTAILGGNNARLYKYPVQQKAELTTDRFAQFRASYEQDGPDRSNRTYGYIRQRLA